MDAITCNHVDWAKPVWSIEHVAALLDVSVDTAREHTYTAASPAPKAGFAKNLWLRDDVLAWFAALPTAQRRRRDGAPARSRSSARATTPAPAGASGAGGAVRRQRDDHADLALVLAVLRAYGDHAQRTGGPAGVKVLREAVFFAWEAPQLPPGGKYSPHLPHSSAARQHRTSGAKGGLVFEHVTPISLVIRSLLADIPPDEEALRRTLDAHSDRVVITKAQDRRLSAAGLRSAAPDPADPWSRYRAIGLDRSDFAPLRQPPVSLA